MAFTTIVSPEELYARLGNPELVVIDCRHSLADFALGRQLYDESHLPGAFFASVEDDLAGAKTGRNGRHPLPDPQDFARFLRACGVGDSTQIVAYDAGADMFAPRFWFLSRWIGHDAVAVLDGGFTQWNLRGYPVTAAPTPLPKEGALTVRLHPEYLVDARYVGEHLNAPELQLLDARAKERYTRRNGADRPGRRPHPRCAQSLVQGKLRAGRPAQIARRTARRVRAGRPRF